VKRRVCLFAFIFPIAVSTRGELREIVFGARSSAGRSPAVTRIDYVDVNTIAVAAIYSIVDRFMNFLSIFAMLKLLPFRTERCTSARMSRTTRNKECLITRHY
jgi:hypothetical protein